MEMTEIPANAVEVATDPIARRTPISSEITNINMLNNKMRNTEVFFTLYNLMGFFGIVSFLPTANNEKSDLELATRKKKCSNNLQVVLRIVSSLVIVTSIAGSMIALKIGYVGRFTKELSKFSSTILFQYANQITIYSKLLLMVWGNTSLTSTSERKSYFEKGNSKINIASVLVLLLIVLSSFLFSLWAYDVSDHATWNLTKIVESYGEFIGVGITKWNKSNETTAFKVNLYENGCIQPLSLILGLVGWSVALSITVSDIYVIVLFCLTAKAAYQFAKDLDLKKDGQSTICDIDTEIYKYKLLVRETIGLNKNIGKFLNCVHLQFIVLLTLFLQTLGWGTAAARLGLLSPTIQFGITLVGYGYAILLSRKVKKDCNNSKYEMQEMRYIK